MPGRPVGGVDFLTDLGLRWLARLSAHVQAERMAGRWYFRQPIAPVG